MKNILVYGDSLSWGIIPNTRRRLRFDQRWPGVMEVELIRLGESVRVVEDCLNGRRTVWEDPFKPGRNGLLGVEQRIEINSPLSLVVLCLGNNDFQSVHHYSAAQSAQGVSAIIAAIRRAPIEPGMPLPPIMVVAPPRIDQVIGPLAHKFLGAETKALGLAEALEVVAEEAGCGFFDAGTVTSASRLDGIHLDEDQHRQLGLAMAVQVQSQLQKKTIV
jgi:lysophospholipase L1-like esterase